METAVEDLPQRPTNPDEAAIFDSIKGFYDDLSQDELIFPSKMSNAKRSLVHSIADAFGLYHKSEGKGRDRHVVVKREAAKLVVGKYSESQQMWAPATSDELSTSYTTDNLVLLTFNVLFEMDDPSRPYHFNDLVYTSLRRPHCFQLLERTNADVIVLQEVTVDFHAELLQQGFVRERYFISDLTAASLVPGNLILSKFPLTKVFLHQFKMSPKTMCLAKGVVNSREISIGAVHLKAGLASQFGFIRARQVREAIQLQSLYKFDDGLLVGDFNFREGSPQMDDPADQRREEVPLLQESGYTDVWVQKHGDSERGFTYDLDRNDLARVISERIRLHEKRFPVNNRFDRIMIKSKDGCYWTCDRIELVGTEDIGHEPSKKYKLFPSDHFGILVTFNSK
eukprot:TRINITY_DN16168_c0_g1_i1.p1 TRINITY_DN16168_c0_g1~~TRINITY_DN16168_c0_g1_i1.p1  ORF type:complete len:396 (-),score=58.28 TRINITY_DN16168_c0_g1_i1:2-1189(-)